LFYDRYLVECNNDKTLVMLLAKVKPDQIHHAGNKSNVLKQLDKCDKWGDCLGLIDEDPESPQPPKLREIRLEPAGYDIKVGKYKGNVVVVLCPELEEWVAKAVKNTDIRKGINAKDLEDERKFETVIRELISSNPEPEPIRRLRNILLKGI
jgi:ribosome assembly protein YihI (activator of Der GTPase)